MTSAVDNDSGRRSRDAAASRRALLDAAGALFHARGYEAPTVREIGERAGVDPALIARYFGGKEGLYLATSRARAPDTLVDRAGSWPRGCEAEGQRGTPSRRALVRAELSDDVRDQVRAVLEKRATGPVVEALEGRGVDLDARLRAELLIALMIGVTLTRQNGALRELAEAEPERILDVLGPAAEMLFWPSAPVRRRAARRSRRRPRPPTGGRAA